MPNALRLSLLLLLALVTSPAAALEPGDYTDRTLQWAGVARTYDLHVPPGYDGETPIPLVLDLHGLSSNGAAQQGISGMRFLADPEGFVIVWPNGLDSSWNGGWCCGDAAGNEVDDVGFLRALAEQLAQELAIDRRRIYVTGLSNGGIMTQRLACEAADVFAAAAPVAFPIGLIPIESCDPVRPMPVLTFQGPHDVLVPYEGGGPFPSAAASWAHWRAQGECGDGEPEIAETTGGSDCKIDTSCAGDAEVGLCTVNSMETIVGGHILYFNPDLDLPELIWGFLSRFTLPGDLPALPTRVAGKKLALKDDADPARRRLALSLKDPALALAPGLDPTAGGATLTVFGTGATTDVACLALPAANWKRKGAGFVYKDKKGTAGPCTGAKLAAGKLELACSAKVAPIPYTLDEPAQGSVTVRLDSPGQTLCATFGGTVQKDTSTAAGKAQFAAKLAPAPAICPAPPPCPAS
jgi:poly(3-hydroxybutyrate) depolymerase